MRNVNLIIEPPAVRRGQHAVLRCMYDLEGAPLYSAKFYRGQLEFYRYTPGEFPNTKVFPFPGIHVDVSSNNYLAESKCINVSYKSLFLNKF